MARIALALMRGDRNRASQRPRDPTGETAPRVYLFDEMFEPRYDESILGLVPKRLRVAYQSLPSWLQLALEVHRRRDEYDLGVTWGERLSLPLMALQRFSRHRTPHVAMMDWFSKPNVRLPMRALGQTLRGIVTWSSVQRAYAIERFGIRPENIYLVKHFVDQLFWSPRQRDVDMICSAGKEMRDFPTLLTALHGTNLRCHIATDRVLIAGSRLKRRTVSAATFAPDLNQNVTVGKMAPTEMRDLYARSRFVVVPILPSDTNNGINVILEAMAMSKPVICSRTRGQVDVIQDGVTGVFVPVGDAAALRAAMVSLWNDPERAEAMGQRARAYVREHHTLEKFCHDVKQAALSALP
jgi:glycosyltransferase involved in cell wall biosynthesis